jgi:GDP-L-fucose synthase
MKEEDFLSGPFEPTNEMYAFAKAFGMRLCSSYRKEYGKNYIACQPCNLYGPKDNYSPENSHVVAALIKKFHDAKKNNTNEVVCWGDGSARREILYSADAAEACTFLMQNYNEEQFLNVGSGIDMTIKELTEKISNIVGYTGKISWDTSKPTGMKQKLLNIDKIKSLGWRPQLNVDKGLELAYSWYVNNIGNA